MLAINLGGRASSHSCNLRHRTIMPPLRWSPVAKSAAVPCTPTFRTLPLRPSPQSTDSRRSMITSASFLDPSGDSSALNPGLQSEKLDADVRRRAEDAILARSRRVTVGDVAAGGGLTLFQAEQALKALASDSLATLAVADDGELLYVFPANFKETIRGKSMQLQMEPVVAGVANAAAYALRVAYGTALIASVVTAAAAILVISSAGKDEKGRGSGGGGGAFVYRGGPRMWFNLSDLLWYWDPHYYRRRQAMFADIRPSREYDTRPPSREMGFMESTFSFVFGDGDPNTGLERRRWEALGRFIQDRGGVVTAEEMAPFLDVTKEQVRAITQGKSVVDESYVMPALTRLGGSPEVDAAGNILYRFPALQQSGSMGGLFGRRGRSTAAPEIWDAIEFEWGVTNAEKGQLFNVGLFGVANFIAVFYLSGLVSTGANAAILVAQGMGWVLGALPAMQLYAASFFLIPLIRYLVYNMRNAGIKERNEAKWAARSHLERPTPALEEKIRSAAQQAQRKVITEEGAVFRSDKAVNEQVIDVEADAWERRLQRREDARKQQSSGY